MQMIEVIDFIQPRLAREERFLVKEEYTAAHIGSGAVRVLATPWMIAFMEITSRNLLDEHLPEGYTSVGTRVDVRHLAPSPIGREVVARVKVEEVEGARVRLAVEVLEGEQPIGKGFHERHVIDVARFIKRVESS